MLNKGLKQILSSINWIDLPERCFTSLLFIEDLTKHGIHLQSIHENIETDSLTGKFFCLMLGYVAEWELQAISERTKDGLRKAKEKGVKLGNKGITKDKEKQIIAQYQQKEMSVPKYCESAKYFHRNHI